MEPLEWNELSNYWKPTPEKEYLVVFTNPRIEKKDFGRAELPPKKCLVLDVLQVNNEVFKDKKEFSTTNHTFIEGVRKIVDDAIASGQQEFAVHLRKSSKGIYSIFSFTSPTVPKSAFLGVKVE